MSDSLTEEERSKYEAMWEIQSYRITSPGYLLSESVLAFFASQINLGDSLTDFGCGSGLATLNFLEKGLSVHLVDIAKNALADKIAALTLLMPDKVRFSVACLWELPDTLLPSDWIYCMDVLEHLPTEKVDAALLQMSTRMKKGGAFQVFLEDEPFGNLIHKTLHLTIQPLAWWLEKLESYFSIVHTQAIIPDVRYTIFVEPKKRD